MSAVHGKMLTAFYDASEAVLFLWFACPTVAKMKRNMHHNENYMEKYYIGFRSLLDSGK